MTQTIYVLLLKDEKWYVGRTNNLEKRLERHRKGEGSEWTIKHPMIKCIHSFETLDNLDEDKIVLGYMTLYGIDNVRGGSFSETEISLNEFYMIRKMLWNASDRCFKCGGDHFVKKCNVKCCERCKHRSHSIKKCKAKKDIDGNSIPLR